MASLQAKIGTEWSRKRENKNYHSEIENFKKIAIKFRKL